MQLIAKDFKALMHLVLALLLKRNCYVECKKVNKKAEGLWWFVMGRGKKNWPSRIALGEKTSLGC